MVRHYRLCDIDFSSNLQAHFSPVVRSFRIRIRFSSQNALKIPAIFFSLRAKLVISHRYHLYYSQHIDVCQCVARKYICFTERHGNQSSRSETTSAFFFIEDCKRCIHLGTKCTPNRPFVKWYGGVKHHRLHSWPFQNRCRACIVKKYRKNLQTKSFVKKQPDARSEKHCIKTGVQS